MLTWHDRSFQHAYRCVQVRRPLAPWCASCACAAATERGGETAGPGLCCHWRLPFDDAFDACSRLQVLAADLDLLNPPADYEKRKHKLKRLVQSPNSFFMDVKCQARRRRAAA